MTGKEKNSIFSRLKGFLGFIHLDAETSAFFDYYNLRSAKVLAIVIMVLETCTFLLSFIFPVDPRVPDPQKWFLAHRIAYAVFFVAALQCLVVTLLAAKHRFSHAAIATSQIALLVVCTVFGIYISAYDYALNEQIFTFITLEVAVSCIFVMRPCIALILVTSGFVAFYKVMGMVNGVSPSTMVNYPILWFLLMTIQHMRYTMFLRITRSSIVNERLNKELTTLSLSDPLTGIKNRHALRQDFTTYLNKPLIIMFSDIDNFKSANDNLGHKQGDEILKDFANALSGQFSSRCCYRIGGDEFLVILSGMPEAEFLEKEARMRLNTSGKLSYSAGYVTCTALDEDNLRNYIDSADKNLYLAKRQGKGHLFGVNSPSR